MDKIGQTIDPRFFQINNLFIQDDQEKASRELSPRFYTYFRSFYKDQYKFQRYFLAVKNIFDITEARGKRVLDAGCGFGLAAISMAILGVGEIVGIDENADMIGVFNRLISGMNPALTNIRAEAGDVLDLQFQDSCFDVIMLIGALSHLREPNLFFSQAHRVLRKGGKLFIAVGNNALNIQGRLWRRKFWKQVETRGADPTIQSMSYFEMRKQIIRGRYPSINDKDLGFLAKQTQGMWGQQITQAVEQFLREGRIYPKPLFKYRDPQSGQPAEDEFNPFKLIKLINDFGFEAKIVPPFCCYTHPFKNFNLKSSKDVVPIVKLYIKKIVKMFYPVSLLASPVFEVIAVKK